LPDETTETFDVVGTLQTMHQVQVWCANHRVTHTFAFHCN